MDQARRRTDELFDLLKPAAIYSRPIPERHRLIFYLGHLEAFDWNQIARNALGVPVIPSRVRQAVRVWNRSAGGAGRSRSAGRLAERA